jgi:hypothetical protein
MSSKKMYLLRDFAACVYLYEAPSPPRFLVWVGGRKIRPIETNAKCCYLTMFICKGILRQVFHLSKAHSPPMTPYSPPHTLYMCILIHRGGGELTRENVTGAKFHKVGRKDQHDLYFQSINFIKDQ